MLKKEEKYVFTFILFVAVFYAASMISTTNNARKGVKCSANNVFSQIAEYEKMGKTVDAQKLYPKLASLLEREHEGTLCDPRGAPIFVPESSQRIAFFLYLSFGQREKAFQIARSRVLLLEKKLSETRTVADSDEELAWINMLHAAKFPRTEIFRLLHEIDDFSGATIREEE